MHLSSLISLVFASVLLSASLAMGMALHRNRRITLPQNTRNSR